MVLLNFIIYVLPPDLILTGLPGFDLYFFFACINVVYGIPEPIDAFEIDDGKQFKVYESMLTTV